MEGITGQVESFYQKAIGNIEQEEVEIETQISNLVEKKAGLSKKCEAINHLRTQFDSLIEEISVVEEEHEAELKKKNELDDQIQQMMETLKQLKAEVHEMDGKLNESKDLRRIKYQALAEMIEKFKDCVTDQLSDEAVADLEQTIRDTEETQPQPSQEPEIDSQEAQTDDENVDESLADFELEADEDEALASLSEESDVTEESVAETIKNLEIDDLNTDDEVALGEEDESPTDDEETILEESTGEMAPIADEEEDSIALESDSDLNIDDLGDDLAEADVDIEEMELDFDEEQPEDEEEHEIKAVPRKSSTEAERLKEALEARDSDDGESLEEMDFDLDELPDDEGEDSSSNSDEADIVRRVSGE